MSVLEQVIPTGYKQTEVGVIPDDWKCIPIGDLNPFVTSGSRGWATYYSEFGDPFVRITNMERSSIYLNMDNTKFVSLPPDSAEGKRTSLINTDILISITADIGICSYVDEKLAKPAFINQHIALIRFENKPVNSKFIAYFLSSEAVQKLFQGSADQGAKAGMNLDSIRKIKTALPELQEQTAIANALSNVDALLTELEKLIAKKQAIKAATMQQLLTGKTRLPQFAYKEFATYTEGEKQGQPKHSSGTNVNVGACDNGPKDGGMDSRRKSTKPSEPGEIPEDWDLVQLGQVSEFINGRAYAIHEWESTGTPVIRLQNLTGRGAEYYYSNLQLPEKQYCNKGDLLFMWSATFGPVIWKGDKAIYHYHIWKIKCRNGFSQEFLYFLLDDMTEKLKRGSSSGGTMLHVTKEMMESTKTIFPSFEEQTAIAAILSDMDNEIQTLKQRLAKTRQIKQGMMQELLTGRTRFPYGKD